MSEPQKAHCPVCGLVLESPPKSHDKRDAGVYECTRCGRFILDALARPVAIKLRDSEPEKAGLLSHLISRMPQDGDPPLLDNTLIYRLLTENEPPSPTRQVQNLVLFLGDRLTAPGEMFPITPEYHRAIVGATTDDNFQWVIKHVMDQGIIEGTRLGDEVEGTLNFKGWELYEDLRRKTVPSRTAFMAMPFGDPTLDKVFDCFKPAVARTGFELVRLDEKPPAGSIDDRLRVEIRRARFLIADLTDGNHGAYWEAGFAEGLGLPVIFTCEETYFKNKGTHFDTSHMHTVLWKVENLEQGADRLTVTIRATLPDDVVLDD